MSSQQHLDARRERADKLDPRVTHDARDPKHDLGQTDGREDKDSRHRAPSDADTMRPDLRSR